MPRTSGHHLTLQLSRAGKERPRTVLGLSTSCETSSTQLGFLQFPRRLDYSTRRLYSHSILHSNTLQDHSTTSHPSPLASSVLPPAKRRRLAPEADPSTEPTSQEAASSAQVQPQLDLEPETSALVDERLPTPEPPPETAEQATVDYWHSVDSNSESLCKLKMQERLRQTDSDAQEDPRGGWAQSSGGGLRGVQQAAGGFMGRLRPAWTLLRPHGGPRRRG